jgi:hypothetical protein
MSRLVCKYCACPPQVDPGCPPQSMACAFPCPPSSSSPAAPDPGLLSVYNDAMKNCEAVPDYTAWAISNGFKSVPKGSACGEGFVPSSSTPAAMTGNAQYDVCFQARRGGMLPFPDGLVARMGTCLAPSPSGSPGPSPSPSGLPMWALTLIFAIVLILFVAGFGYMISKSKTIN